MDGIYYVLYLVLLQIRLEELGNLLKEVETCVCTVVDAVVAVGVECCLELLVSLCECAYVVYHVTQVYIVIGCSMYKQQVSFEVACIDNC